MPDLSPARPGELVAFLCDSARALERDGELWRALAESRIALTVDGQSPCAAEIRRRLEGTIDRAVTGGVRSGQAAQARGDWVEAQRSFLRVLALQPSNHTAFKALQTPRPPGPSVEGRFISHRVRQGETLEFLAELYYGDRSRGELLAKVNGLSPGRPLVPGREVKIPEIPGVPILRPDR
jgi:nucleoid-associated protein YgaU